MVLRLGRRGGASLETVVVIPIIFSFLLASVDVFKIGYAWVLLSRTVSDSVEWASSATDGVGHSGPGMGEIERAAERLAGRLGLEGARIQVNAFRFDWSNARGLRSNSVEIDRAYNEMGGWTTGSSPGEPIRVVGEVSVPLSVGRWFMDRDAVTLRAMATGAAS